MEQQSISSDLIRGHIDTIILHTLLNGDKFAQQISDTVERKSDNVYKLNQATLYSSLKRLENLKLVVSYWQDCDNGGRRKFFKLTDSGKNTVESNLKNWSFSRNIIDKLIDCEQKIVVNNDKIDVESSILSESEHVEVQNNQVLTQPIPVQTVSEKQEQTTLPNFVNAEPVITQSQINVLNELELNFRDILNDIAPQNNKLNATNDQTNEEKQNDSVLSEEELNFRNILNNLVSEKNSPEQSVINLNGINIIDLQKETDVLDQNITESDNQPLLENIIKQEETQNTESDQERNFRNVLRELIKPSTLDNKAQEKQDIQTLEPIENIIDQIDTPKTIENNSANVKYSLKQRNHSSFKNITSIDYSDLRLMASQDGLKLRISSKTSSRSLGNLFVNKLQLITSLSMFLLALIQLLIVTSVYKAVLQPAPGIIFATIAVFAVLPLVFLTKYLTNPTKTSSKVITKDSILTTAIVVFNLILINFACIMLVNLDFTILKDVVLYVIIPMLLYIDVLICSIVNYFVGNSTICKIKSKKTTQ